MGLDIRIPLGMIFLIIGGIMAVFGLITHGDGALYDRSLGIDLNLTWGATMFVFGLVMFVVGKHQKWHDDPANPRPWERQPKSRRGH